MTDGMWPPLNGDMTLCPMCSEPVTLPTVEQEELGGRFPATAAVITDPGTFNHHLRDAHPEWWAEQCDLQRRFNANPFIRPVVPRKVNGTPLLPGEDVGDLP